MTRGWRHDTGTRPESEGKVLSLGGENDEALQPLGLSHAQALSRLPPGRGNGSRTGSVGPAAISLPNPPALTPVIWDSLARFVLYGVLRRQDSPERVSPVSSQWTHLGEPAALVSVRDDVVGTLAASVFGSQRRGDDSRGTIRPWLCGCRKEGTRWRSSRLRPQATSAVEGAVDHTPSPSSGLPGHGVRISESGDDSGEFSRKKQGRSVPVVEGGGLGHRWPIVRCPAIQARRGETWVEKHAAPPPHRR